MQWVWAILTSYGVEGAHVQKSTFSFPEWGRTALSWIFRCLNATSTCRRTNKQGTTLCYWVNDCESVCAFQQWLPISKMPGRPSFQMLKRDLCSLSSRGQYLFKNKPPDGTAPPNSFYRALYPKIIQDIEVRSKFQVWWAVLFCFFFLTVSLIYSWCSNPVNASCWWSI